MQAIITAPIDADRANNRTLILSARGEDGWATEHRLIIEATVIIGTAGQCGLALAGDSVSALHCSIRWDENGIWLEDWGSSSGTFLDGERVTTEVAVELKSTICVGAYTISLSFDGPQQPQPPRAAVEINTTVGSGNLAVVAEGSPTAIPTNLSTPCEDVVPKPPTLARASTSPVMCDGDPAEVQWDARDQETFDLLRAEVEQLQFEIAERDAELAEALATEQGPETLVDGASLSQLMERLESQLDELERSDERISTLEELLRVTDEANRDEREERRQMESWLGDIESVFGDHLATWKAEMTELRRQSAATAAERDQLLKQRTQPAADGHTEQDAEAATLRLQLKHLQQRLDEATAVGTRQQEELQRLESQLGEAAEAETSLREDHLKLAAERASLSRLRHEIIAEQAENQKSMQDARTETDIDSRVRGFRQHLSAIQEEEDQEPNAPSLSVRISQLWKRIEAHR